MKLINQLWMTNWFNDMWTMCMSENCFAHMFGAEFNSQNLRWWFLMCRDIWQPRHHVATSNLCWWRKTLTRKTIWILECMGRTTDVPQVSLKPPQMQEFAPTGHSNSRGNISRAGYEFPTKRNKTKIKHTDNSIFFYLTLSNAPHFCYCCYAVWSLNINFNSAFR